LFDLRDGVTDWGYLYWDYETGVYNFSGLSSNAQTFAANEWQHVAVTWESGSRKMYVNGVLENSDSTSMSSSIPSLLYIGERYSQYFQTNGALAEFATFDRALTAIEVAALHRMGAFASRQD